MRDYLIGSDIIGAPVSGRAILIQVRDVPALVQAQGGSSGSLVQKLVPDTIEATVYRKMAQEMANGLREKGVDADVRVVSPVGFKPARNGEFSRGVIAGVGLLGVALLAWKYGVKGLIK